MKYITVLKFNFTQNKTVQNIQIFKFRIFIFIYIYLKHHISLDPDPNFAACIDIHFHYLRQHLSTLHFLYFNKVNFSPISQPSDRESGGYKTIRAGKEVIVNIDHTYDNGGGRTER